MSDMTIKEKSVVETEITAVTNEGAGVSRCGGMVLFTPFTVVGDTAKVKIVKVGKTCLYGELVEVTKPSPERIEPDCPSFGECGGCTFRHMTYEAEKEQKTAWVEDHIRRIGGFNLSPFPVKPSPQKTRYRNKAIYQVGKTAEGKIVFGFYKRKSHEIVDGESCLLQPEIFSKILSAVRFFIEQNRISIYDEETNRGLFRAVYLRQGEVSGEIGVCLVLNGEKLPSTELLVSVLSTNFPQIVSIVLNVNKERTNVVLGKEFRTIYGKDGITDVLCGVTVDLSPAAFYQVNHGAAELLYGIAAEYAALSGTETVLDLYCGAGTIGLSMAKNAGKLIGVEIVPEAIENARKNAERMGVHKAEFLCGDAAKAAETLRKRGLRPNVIILDPPRKGCSEETLAAVASMAPDRIVMVSCNTATMARDFKILASFGYQPQKVQPVDLFPRTANCEAVALLTKE